jgi:hypothetical protein
VAAHWFAGFLEVVYFIMEGRMNMFRAFCTALAVMAAVTVAPAAAFDRSGKIDADLSYENLEVRSSSGGRCRISGTLINETSEIFHPVFLTFYARNNQGRMLWDTLVRVSVLDARGEADFSDTFTCTERGYPYTIEITATK